MFSLTLYNLKKRHLMKKTIFLISILISLQISAQITIPRVSQKASLSQTIALTDITLNYSRPQVKGRKIFGELEPFGKVWRTGANEVTNISFSTDVKINGFNLKAGKYALVSLPTEKDWTFIFNKDAEQWGAFSYNDSFDALRILAKKEVIPSKEVLSFYFEELTQNSVKVVLEWETVRASFTVEADPMTVVAAIQKSLVNRKPTDWRSLYNAANYCFVSDVNHDEAQQWLNTSLEIRKDAGTYFLKARLAKQVKSNKDAKSFAEVAKELAKKEENPNKQLISDIEEFLKSL